MFDMKKVLILCGGGGEEHSISLISAEFIKEQLSTVADFHVEKKELLLPISVDQIRDADFVIPCMHGYPGETGDIQSVLELMNIPYLGCRSEACRICFNKITTKLWLSALDIPNTPWFFCDSEQKSMDKALDRWKKVFVKASAQGSSIGCAPAKNKKELIEKINSALGHSPHALVEKNISGRELEVACYEYKGKLTISRPGEIIPPKKFYSYEEKYADNSQTSIHTVAKGLEDSVVKIIQLHAETAFKNLKLRHLARIDFFLTEDDKILLNEINTFPGMTSISLFPAMLKANGHSFVQFLSSIIKKDD